MKGFIDIFRLGKRVYSDKYFIRTAELSKAEKQKTPRRTDIINFWVSKLNARNYLEIGVRNPRDNFNKIQCQNKFSVDPGVEFEENPVDFKVTSDAFFEKLKNSELNIEPHNKFDVIFIDGLHISDQVERDILNSIEFLNEKGVIILHDCNPPSEFHQRETYDFKNSPAKSYWNGTTWKAFYKFRHEPNFYSICYDNDWGVGIISREQYPLFNNIKSGVQNEFYEFSVLEKFRTEHMNLIPFDEWKEKDL